MAGEHEKKRVAVVSLADRGELVIGCFLIALSFAMPLLLTVHNFQILDRLHDALEWEDSFNLMIAALSLVALNALRAAPHYIGAFLVAESMEFRWGTRSLWAVNALLVVGILQVTYWGINTIHHQVRYDFGLPAVLVSGFVILIDHLDYKYIARMKKTLLIFTGLTAFQFLDIMPAASSLPVGRGETSTNIKLAGNVLGLSDMLNGLAAVGFLLFLGISVLFFIMLRDENKLREIVLLREQNEVIQTRARINEMQNRTYREMQHLVHDLKSPLTVVQTLVGAVKLDCAQAGQQEDMMLLDRAESAVEQMSQMISEILYEEKVSATTVEAVLNRVLAQLSIEDYARYIRVESEAPQAEIRVHRVLFSRALMNLVQNSAKAIPAERTPCIVICSGVSDGWVRFQVMDNGGGIPEEKQAEIWNRGYSGTASSGLGLSFVRNVVDRANGKVRLCSRVGEGTTITLWIPKEGENYGSDPKDDDLVH